MASDLFSMRFSAAQKLPPADNDYLEGMVAKMNKWFTDEYEDLPIVVGKPEPRKIHNIWKFLWVVAVILLGLYILENLFV